MDREAFHELARRLPLFSPPAGQNGYIGSFLRVRRRRRNSPSNERVDLEESALSPNREHYPELSPTTCDRWIASATGPGGRHWAATRFERDGASRISLLRDDPQCPEMVLVAETDIENEPHRPAIFVSNSGVVHLLWNSLSQGGWRILHGTLKEGSDRIETETVWASKGYCLPPCLAEKDGALWAAWAAREGRRTRIVAARRLENGAWRTTAVLPGEGFDARPCLADTGSGMLAAWDRYRDGRREIVCASLDNSLALIETHRLRDDRKNRLSPVATRRPEGGAHLAFVEIEEVLDEDRGIFEHSVAARCVVVGAGEIETVASADLNPGLLAADGETYFGFDGLRRRPQLAVLSDGSAWLCWEGRRRTGKKRDGRLLGARIGEQGTRLLHEVGFSYAVAPSADGTELAIAHIGRQLVTAPVVNSVRVNPSEAGEVSESGSWAVWSPVAKAPARAELPPIEADGKTLSLYWLDLHCHSVWSPDAEGEPDELIEYARDFAGLDGMAVVDNDFYTNKALARSEWAIETDFAEAFTEPGRFAVFPAFEYTFHNPRMTPDFNHRYVLYREHGPLIRRIDAEGYTYEDMAANVPEDGLVVVHHCTWRLGGGRPEPVEVCSSWRVCIEETDFIHKRLAAGDRFGFLATSDSHRGCPGLGGALTGVFAEELTREALFEAILRRRTLATQGERVLVDFRAGGLFMGEEGEHEGPPRLALRVVAPRPVEFAEIVRDGETAFRLDGPPQEFSETFDDKDCGPGSHYYFARVKLEGDPSFNAPGKPADFYRPFVTEGRYPHNLANARGPFAWTSPAWLNAT